MASRLTDIEIDEYQRQGQELYRQRKYQAALQRFNAIVQQERKTPLNTLDNRAATYAKLGNLQAALRDGRSMIQDYKRSCSGYLRTGQVLQLLSKEDAALGIYKYGIRNVPSTDPSRELIRGMYDKLVKRCSPSKAADPLLVLPIEIAKMVIEYLNFKQMVNATRVSQSWRALLHSMPNLWSHLDFSTTTKNISLLAVAACIKRSRGRVKSATMSGVSFSQSAVLKCIATRCKALVHLQICYGITGTSLVESAPALGSLETLMVGAEISLDAVSHVLDICGRLKKAEFRSVTAKHSVKWTGDLSQLRSLTIDAKKDGPDTRGLLLQINTLVPRIGNIRELNLRHWKSVDHPYPVNVPDFSSLTQLENLSLVGLDPRGFPAMPRSIKTLDVSSWQNCDVRASHGNIRSASLDSLTSLSIARLFHFSTADLYALLEPNKGNLQKLDITACAILTPEDLKQLAISGYLSGIVELVLPATLVNDEALETLAAHLHCLTRLDLKLTPVTGVGIKALTNKPGSKLEWLNLNHCQDVGVDAVEYARSQGIEVSFKFQDVDGKSRRVRM